MVHVLTLFVSIFYSTFIFAAFEPGDVLLHSARCGDFCDSIRAVSQSPVDHAGIVIASPNVETKLFGLVKSNYDGIVVEAWTPIAKETPLKEFLARDNGKYIQLRLKPEYRTQESIDSVIRVANSYIGKEYDYYFEENEEKIYCSELVYKAYEKGANIEAGKIQKANEFDRKYAEGYWTDHFKGNIPWERNIITPAGLMINDKFYVVHSGY